MPIYVYKCTVCGTKFSIDVPLSSKPPEWDVYCPKCHKNGIVKRTFEKMSFVLKGKGFYLTDNRETNDE